ncbi:hypothetical protein J4E83_010075 [Alternaria metachromatica]|uniref:uncharacterized protein n=1 Tax=Alternaria metachromatica TaxID=283354 RepID=UPI0020C4F337|nr:uncharacterized protein J4E83_010075 [Alternaria metachromatica]KAI4606484.1 hypothetical protein J4E83_010075 [Alternaria metachromatica]
MHLYIGRRKCPSGTKSRGLHATKERLRAFDAIWAGIALPETLPARVPEVDQKILPVYADIEDRNGAGSEPTQPSSPPASPAPLRKRARIGTVNAPVLLSSDVQNEDHTEPEPRADDYIKVVCASKLYNDMPFRQKVIKDTYIFLRQMRPDHVPWTAGIWDTNTARDGTILGGCMFAQADPAKAHKQNKLVKSPGIVLEYGIYAGVGCMLVHERFDILRILEKVQM